MLPAWRARPAHPQRVEHDERGVAPQFQAHPLDRGCALRHQYAADLRRSGEGQYPHGPRRGQHAADGNRVPMPDIQDPGRQLGRSASLASASALSGVSLAGFSTTVQPAAIAGATLRAIIRAGKFHGVIAATTPTGWRSANRRRPSRLCGMTSRLRKWPAPLRACPRTRRRQALPGRWIGYLKSVPVGGRHPAAADEQLPLEQPGCPQLRRTVSNLSAVTADDAGQSRRLRNFPSTYYCRLCSSIELPFV